jgi:hypothetical protein
MQKVRQNPMTAKLILIQDLFTPMKWFFSSFPHGTNKLSSIERYKQVRRCPPNKEQTR